MGQIVKLLPELSVIRTVNDKLMSYNVEMTEIQVAHFGKNIHRSRLRVQRSSL